MDSTGAAANLSYQLMFGIIGMILLTTFVILFFVIYQRRLLQQKWNTQQLEAAYQKELLHAGVLAQEAERKRMAVELHDSVGGLLSTTKIYLTNISQEIAAGQFQLFKDKALEALNENIGEIRTITNDLMPQSLERLGVVAATRDLTGKLTELKGSKVAFSHNADIRFEKDREKALFRILQELINNALKHSSARQVAIDFHFEPRRVLVHYQEDGQGFDREAYEMEKAGKSFGLKTMESRVAFLGGKMQYTTAPGQGIDVRLTVPLPAQGTAIETYGNTH
jgi:signal transduction histidine kinase